MNLNAYQKNALINRIHDILPLKENIDIEKPIIESAPDSRVITFGSPRDIYREVVAYYLFTHKIIDDLKVVQAYDFCERYCSGLSDSGSGSLDCYDYPILVVLLGYNEMHNKQLVNITNQVISNIKIKSKGRVIFFHHGLRSAFINRFNRQSEWNVNGIALDCGEYIDLTQGVQQTRVTSISGTKMSVSNSKSKWNNL